MARIVLTHGFGGAGAQWATLGGLLADAGHEVVSWDLPGHGNAGAASDGRYDRDIALDLLDGHVGDGRAVLAGHSLGGYLSLAYALRQPDRVAALVLLATGPGFKKPDALAKWNRMVDRVEAQFGVAAGSAGLAHQHDSVVLDGLTSISVPTLLIVGERDHRFHVPHQLMAERIGAESITIDGAGHQLHMTHAPAIASAVLALLGQQGVLEREL